MSTATTNSIALSNDLDELARLPPWLESIDARHSLGSRLVFKINLVLEECVTNIIRYAFSDNAQHQLDILLSVRPGVIEIVVEDDGTAFDPLSQPLFSPPASLQDADIGGLGIHLMRRYTSQMSYRRKDGRNCLSMSLVMEQVNEPGSHTIDEHSRIKRKTDRRTCNNIIDFPLKLEQGDTINQDRRISADRRELAFIASQDLFRGVPWYLIEDVILSMPTRSLDKGDILIRQGDENHNLYLVRKGQLDIHLDTPDSNPCFVISSGQCAGDMSIIDGKPASAFVIASEPTTVIIMPADTFWHDIVGKQNVARNMMQMLVERMRAQNQEALQALRQQLQLQHLQKELSIAHDIQLNMLPHLPLLEGHNKLMAHAIMKPAQDVGGDFYDLFALDDGRVYVAVGDVSGKGIPAALFMVRTMTLLRGTILRGAGLKQAIQEVNDTLCINNDSCMFATAFIAILDPGNHTLEMVCAGHLPPLLGSHRKGYQRTEIEKNLIIGVKPGHEFATRSRKIEPGDTLFIYSDGITEAEDPEHNLLGDNKLLELIDSVQTDQPVEIVETVLQEVVRHTRGHPQSDDITMLAIRLANRLDS